MYVCMSVPRTDCCCSCFGYKREGQDEGGGIGREMAATAVAGVVKQDNRNQEAPKAPVVAVNVAGAFVDAKDDHNALYEYTFAVFGSKYTKKVCETCRSKGRDESQCPLFRNMAYAKTFEVKYNGNQFDVRVATVFMRSKAEFLLPRVIGLLMKCVCADAGYLTGFKWLSECDNMSLHHFEAACNKNV